MPQAKQPAAYLLEDEGPRDRRHGLGIGFVALTLTFWAFNFLVNLVSNRLDGLPDWQARSESRLVVVCVGVIICFIIDAALKRCRDWPFWKRALLAFGLAIVGGDALTWANTLALQAVGARVQISVSAGTVIFYVLYWTWFLFAWASLYLAFTYSFEVREKERRWSAIQGLAQAAQMRALQYQIRPHFLFNSLNAIAALVLDSRGDEAVTMVRRLSDFLRRSLELDPVADISIGDEIELQARYLEVERARFPDLALAVDVDPEVRDTPVPALILQPIVENAVKFAVGDAARPPRVALRARGLDGQVEITIEDNGGGTQESGSGAGIGLRNVRKRLAQRYGNRHRFEAGPAAEGGFRVRIVVPAEDVA